MSNDSERLPLSQLDAFFAQEMQRRNSTGVENDETAAVSATLQHGRIEGGSKQGSLQEIEVEFVRNPDRGPDFDARHNASLITRELIQALVSEDADRMRNIENQIRESGGFLMTYDGEGRERLEQAYDFKRPQEGGWLMAETSAKLVDRHGVPVSEQRILGADGQFLIPQDSDDVLPADFPLLGEHDALLDGETVSMAVRSQPSSAMLIADINALRKYARYGLAAVTEDAAFARLIHEINTQREHKIKYILAAIASVKGLFLSNGALAAPAKEPGMRNWRSLNLHYNRKNAPGFLHGKQRNRTVDVELPAGDMGKLLVDWYVTVQEVEHIVPNTKIRIIDEEYPPKTA